MLHDRLTECAIEEIANKSFGVVEQFFKIHDIVYVDKTPKIERIDTENDDTAVVYFPIKDEDFHLALSMSKTDMAVTGVHIESYNTVYFAAHSEQLKFLQLSSMTKLKSTEGKNKGEQERRYGFSLYKDNWILFEPNPEPDSFEDKLKKLLDFLEQDKAGIKKLVDTAHGSIQAHMIFHNGSAILGSPRISKKIIQRMAALNLEINFDLYAGAMNGRIELCNV